MVAFSKATPWTQGAASGPRLKGAAAEAPLACIQKSARYCPKGRPGSFGVKDDRFGVVETERFLQADPIGEEGECQNIDHLRVGKAHGVVTGHVLAREGENVSSRSKLILT